MASIRPKITLRRSINHDHQQPIVAAFCHELKTIPNISLPQNEVKKLFKDCTKPWDSRLRFVKTDGTMHPALLINVGPKDTLKRYSLATVLKNMGATTVRQLSNYDPKDIELYWDQIKRLFKSAFGVNLTANDLQHILLGAYLATYAYSKPMKKKSEAKPPFSMQIISKQLTQKQLDQNPIYFLYDAVTLARNLANDPANVCTPVTFASTAQKTLKDIRGVRVKVHDKTAIKKMGMDLFLSVNKGSKLPPRLVEIDYTGPKKGKKNLPKVALVGKGITFDTGGYSLKPASFMVGMKYDMSGGATMLAVTYAAALLRLPIQLKTFIPLTDNAVDSNANMPGDVIQSLSGLTVEIENTDAEGRLILADALTLASQWKPDCMFDAATLTGAVVIALGTPSTGMMGNSDTLAKLASQSADESGERVWRLPLFPEMDAWFKSDVADLKNISNVREAGSSGAGTFLSRFVPKTLPWLHFDIAASASDNKTRKFYPSSGSSGAMIMTIVRMLEKIGKSGRVPK